MAEGGLAELAQRQHPAGDAVAAVAGFGLFRLQAVAPGQQVLHRIGRLEGVAIEVDAKGGEGVGLLPALGQYLVVLVHGP